jgi:hypothetical protein
MAAGSRDLKAKKYDKHVHGVIMAIPINGNVCLMINTSK